ncbi:MAG: hypothetical protein EP330_25750 [Deltaproteobacteria bacterium]|nr:MAG: hypothetical protein EP330_25750 [Deltaproteobacteria bacterium]
MESAAFVRVEGVLTGRPTLASAAWLAANAQLVRERFTRLGAAALALPFAISGGRTDAMKLGWAALRGQTEDRITVLGEELFEAHFDGKLREAGVELVAQARKRHDRVVLISDNLAEVMQPLADQLGAELLCNRLEYRDGRATGRLLDPVVGENVGGMLKQWAREHDVDLDTSAAYGSAEADKLLLAQVGLPCAAHPDRGLRRVARELDWPIVEAR